MSPFEGSLGRSLLSTGPCSRRSVRPWGTGSALTDIDPEHVSTFLMGVGPLTASWQVKHNALLGFYRYAISRGFITNSPLPLVIPKRPPAFQPYIYSQAELRHLMDATASYQRHRGRLDPFTVRTLLLLMYAAALRASETLSFWPAPFLPFATRSSLRAASCRLVQRQIRL